MLIIRGVNVYPSEIEAVILADPTVGPQYLLVLDNRSAMTRLVVCCESSSTDSGSRLTSTLAARLGIHCDVHVVAPGNLPRTEVGKAVRVLRWSTGDSPVPGL
jgi:phenylacetate-CoA ligase